MIRNFVGGLVVMAAASSVQAQVQAKPKLIVAIAVDQYSSDLFNEYRAQMTGGIKRLMQGAVFPSGFQSHAATETCPGHSTILTGARPSRNGIIANDWSDPKSTRIGRDGKPDYAVYCAEDESIPGTNSSNYVVSPVHLKVPTLGDRLKAVSPQTRVVSVAGKDRAAVMLGGHKTDQAWWWGSKEFVSYATQDKSLPPPASVARVNALVKAAIDKPVLQSLPLACVSRNLAVPVVGGSVGTLQPRKPGDARAFRASSDLDRMTMALAEGLRTEMKLGQGTATDVLAIGLSATDIIGHSFGTSGGEMCAQIHAVDAMLGSFFAKLDAAKIPYAVTLTADHGGHDLPERNRQNGIPNARRVAMTPNVQTIATALAAKYGVPGPVLIGSAFGDVYLASNLPADKRAAIQADAREGLLKNPDVEAVLTREQIAAEPSPSGPPENWSLLARARASYDPARSGDLLVLLKEWVTPIPAGAGYVATHGSIWNYDRRVPILFWYPGIRPMEQPNGIETVDIMPTLASLVGLALPPDEIDGRCLDIVAGQASNCQ